jgi:solute carrier family 32 (vesicular inhibitory amino acid transporter)
MSFHRQARSLSISVVDHARRFSEFTSNVSSSYGKSLEYPYLQMQTTLTDVSISPSVSESPQSEKEESISDENQPLLAIEEEQGTTKAQGIFNTVNILMGISILALPYALHLSGLIIGLLMFLVYSLITNYTGKLLAKCMKERCLQTYSDIAYAALGQYGCIVTVVFIMELTAAGVALLILVEDSVLELVTMNRYLIKFVAYLVATPFLWTNSLKILSYTSLVGIITFFYLLFVLLIQGLLVNEQPGSLINHMPVSLKPDGFWRLWMSSGLIMASYAGHGCIPSV